MPNARFLIVARRWFFIILFALVALGLLYRYVGRQLYQRISAESVYRSRYGAEWKQHYAEEMHATVEENHKKVLVGAGGLVAVGVLSYLVYREAAPKRQSRRGRRRRRRAAPIPS